MHISFRKIKNRDPKVIDAIRLMKFVHMLEEEDMAVIKSLNIVNALQKHRTK